MKILVFTSNKGGVGKTSSCSATAAILKDVYHQRVLCLDCDCQRNLSYSFGIDDEEAPSMFDVLMYNTPIQDVIVKTDQCDIVPATMAISALPKMDADALKESLLPVADQYDYVLLDTAPGISTILYSCLYAADTAVICGNTEGVQSLQGIQSTVKLINDIDSPLQIGGILMTECDSRTNLGKGIIAAAKEIANNLESQFYGSVRRNVSVAEAWANRTSITQYDPDGKACQDYKEYVKKLLEGEHDN